MRNQRSGRRRIILCVAAVLLIGIVGTLWIRLGELPAVAGLFDRRVTATASVSVRNHIDPLVPGAPRERLPSGKTRLALAKNRPVLEQASKSEKVQKLGVGGDKADPVAWLEKEIQVSFTTPEVMEIRLKGEHPEQLKAIVDAVADAFVAEVNKEEQQRRSKILERIREIEKSYTERLKQTRNAVRTFKEVLGTGEQEPLVREIQRIHTELHNATEDLAKFNQQVKRLRVEIKDIGDKRAFPEVTEAEFSRAEAELAFAALQDVELQSLKAEEGQVKLILEGIKAKYTFWQNAPKAKPWLNRLEQIDKRRRERREELRQHLLKGNQGVGDGKALETQVRHLEELAKGLEHDTLALKQKAVNLVFKGLDLDDFTREITEVERLVQNVSQRAEALQIQLNRAPLIAKQLKEATIE